MNKIFMRILTFILRNKIPNFQLMIVYTWKLVNLLFLFLSLSVIILFILLNHQHSFPYSFFLIFLLILIPLIDHSVLPTSLFNNILHFPVHAHFLLTHSSLLILNIPSPFHYSFFLSFFPFTSPSSFLSLPCSFTFQC